MRGRVAERHSGWKKNNKNNNPAHLKVLELKFTSIKSDGILVFFLCHFIL